MKSILCLLVVVVFMAACSTSERPMDYDVEFASIERNIEVMAARLIEARQKNNSNLEKELTYKHVYLLYQRSALSGDYKDYRLVETALEKAFALFGESQSLYLIRAYFNFKLHRLDQAKQDLEKLANLSSGLQVRALWADISFQEGHYAKALAAYESLEADFESWDTLARWADYELKTGHPDKADAFYQRAREKMNAKEMRSYAWLELQRGLIDFEYGRYAEALAHYRQADREYSGYWLIEEHIAEVLALMGNTNEAVALYEEIIQKTGAPEFMTALASLVEKKDPGEAAVLRKRADDLYAFHMAQYPEAVMGHLIKYLLLRDDSDARLLEYAQENTRLRPNAESRLLLLKALMKLNRPVEAKQLLSEILQTPWRTPEVARFMEVFGIASN